MIKIIDKYVIRIFLGPFLFIFSVLFFIFIVQFAWQELDRFMGKGLNFFQILKLLMYLGITVIQLVLPLTILLASIMTFGQLGESYELTAIKASGVSLLRVMLPIFVVVNVMAVGLFYFSNQVVPNFQEKARNMLINITKTKPALSFEAGKFINDIPKMSMRINKIEGEDGDQFSDIIIHTMAPLSEDIQTIVAHNGTLQPTDNKFYLKFELYDGYVYESQHKNKSSKELQKQPYQIIKYDTLVRLFDISEIVKSAMEEQSGGNHYKFLNYNGLQDTVVVMDSTIQSMALHNKDKILYGLVPNKRELDSLDFSKKYTSSIALNTLNKEKRLEIGEKALNMLDRNQSSLITDVKNLKYKMTTRNKAIMYQQNMITYSVTCILFFLIGASLGSIIRKGGLGMPVVVAIVVFVVFFVLYTVFYQSSKNDLLNPYLAAWLPNIILTPLAILFTTKAVNDSQLFDISKYQEPIRKISSKFTRNKKSEHSRYQ